MPARGLAVCFFLSGFAALVLEIVWSRSLALHLGGSAAGVTAVVTAYMAGLGLGSLVAGRLTEGIVRPLRTYAFLEIAIAVFAVASPLVLRLPEPLYRLAHDFEETSWWIPFGVRFSTSLVLLLLPTAGMGATLPLLVSGLARRGGEIASRVALLYGINTIGAVAGTLAAGFLLLPSLGVTRTLWVAAGVDLSVATFLLAGPASSMERGREDQSEKLVRSGGRGMRPMGSDGIRAAARRLALVLFAISGGLSMVYELGWTRRLVTLWGSSVYSFTLLLATFLAGLGIGSLVAKRFAERSRRPIAALGTGFALTGVAALGGTSLLALIPTALQSILRSARHSAGVVLAGEVAVAAAVLLPATLLLGSIFPLAVRVAQREGENPGAVTGRAYAVNTAGTVVGAAGTGLFLLPSLGAFAALRAAALAHLAIGIALLLLFPGRNLRRAILSAAALPAVFLAIWLAAPAPNIFRMNYGIVNVLRDIAKGASPDSLTEISLAGKPVHPTRLLFLEEGLSATVAVRTSWHFRGLVINGKTDASNEDSTQTLLGQLPMTLADSPRRVLVIGYGSGITTHSVLTHPVERVETVEIEPAIVRAGRFFSDLNGQERADPRSTVLFEDGRTHLAYTRETYDVIISEPSNPWIAGINNLFTADFFDLVKRRLAPGGVFCQWLHTYEMSRETLASLLGTLHSSIPGAEVYAEGSDLLVIWKRDGALLSRERMERAFAIPAVRSDFALIGFHSPADLLALYQGPLEAVVRTIGNGPPNTDDSPFVEFRAPFDLLRGGETGAFRMPLVQALPLQRFDAAAPIHEILALLGEGLIRAHNAARAREVVAALAAIGAPDRAATLRARADRIEAETRARERVVVLLGQSDEAFDAGDLERAEAHVVEARLLLPDDPEVLYMYGRVELNLKKLDEAGGALRRAFGIHRDSLRPGDRWNGLPYQTAIYLGILSCALRNFDEGLRWFDFAKSVNPFQSVAYSYKARVLADIGRHDEARREVAAGLALDPKDGLLLDLDERFRPADR